MFNDFRFLSITLVIIALFVLIAFSFIKYNNIEESKHSQVVYSVNKGEKKLFSFLNYIQNMDWLKLQKPAIIENSELEEEKKDLLNIKQLNIFDYTKASFEVTNWRSLWTKYWQNNLNWFNDELEKVKNN